MFNAKRIETIRKNIQSSTLLSDREKSDWLNLLELMNDKQLTELEDILASQSSAQPAQPAQAARPGAAPAPVSTSPKLHPTPASKPPADFVQKLPPLTHIANMPTDVSMTNNFSSKPSQPTPPSKPSVDMPRPMPPSPNYSKLARPVAVPSPSAQTAPHKGGAEIYAITSIEELSELSLESIRTHNLQSIFDVIKKTIEDNGYFTVLQLIESSPLYKGYIETGKARLGAQPQTLTNKPSDFSQEELEFMTDLLRNMRFNRW